MMLSIIIPTYNRNDLLEKCLDSLKIALSKINDELYEVIVSDDSQNGIAKPLIEDKFNFVTWVEGPKRGPAANRNFGVQSSKGEWLLFTDDDCLPQIDWVKSYFDEIQVENVEDVLEGKTVADRERMRYDEVAPLNIDGNKLWSCNFAIKRVVFDEVGGFDEGFPHSTMEDIDFYARVLKVTTIRFLPQALVIHPWRRRIGFKHFKVRLKSQSYYAAKHGIKNTLNFRFERLKIFVGGVFTNFRLLSKFSMRGWCAYLDKCAFDLCMIFI